VDGVGMEIIGRILAIALHRLSLYALLELWTLGVDEGERKLRRIQGDVLGGGGR
jgi:hypothetical protein